MKAIQKIIAMHGVFSVPKKHRFRGFLLSKKKEMFPATALVFPFIGACAVVGEPERDVIRETDVCRYQLIDWGVLVDEWLHRELSEFDVSKCYRDVACDH